MPNQNTNAVDMNLVVSDIQRYAAASEDNVPLSLWAQQRLEDQTQVNTELGTVTQSMRNQLDTIQQDVSLMATLNESTNANNFIADISNSQKLQLENGFKDVNREQSLVTRQLLDSVYLRDRYTVGMNIFKATLLLLVILFTTGVVWNMGRLDFVSTIIMSATAIVIYVAYVVINMVFMGRRLRERGNKMSWSVTASMKSDMARLASARNC